MAFLVAGLLLLTERVHSGWLVRVPVWGQIPDPAIPLIIAISFRRPDWGPVVGLGVGLLQDLLFGGGPRLFALAQLLLGPGPGGVARGGLSVRAVGPAFAATRLLLRAPRAARPRERFHVI